MVNGLSKYELGRNRSYTLLEIVLSYLILVENFNWKRKNAAVLLRTLKL